MLDNTGASNPAISATVSASAGTGKTWMLITRMVRLLLDGARPEGLLAITFTRKAATEMQMRLRERLLMLACADDDALAAEFSRMHMEPAAARADIARGLYETVLRSPRPPRTTTFHAFCQDILRRFPLEAGIAPGFELLEATHALEREAFDALFAEATQEPDHAMARALDTLTDFLGSTNAETALESFIAYRSDWWAYGGGNADAVTTAQHRCRALLDVDFARDPHAEFMQAHHVELAEFMALLEQHATTTNLDFAARLYRALHADLELPQRFAEVTGVFLTQKGEPRSRKSSGTQRKAMGEAGEQRFLDLHEKMCMRISATLDELRARDTFTLTSAWMLAGQRLLEHFQRIKNERRQLDFTDLEWHTYALLNHSDNAQWVQYKLDQRIDHLLIDEFQDTNPVQWRMLLPLLREFAAQPDERARSVFLVGDGKQSIYRFRRADARLFTTAQQWLGQHLGAQSFSLDRSRRSAPAVIDCVNAVFSSAAVSAVWPDFPQHQTVHASLHGRVELLPLIANASVAAAETTGALRNPLLQPRAAAAADRHRFEGDAIARRIRALLDTGTAVVDNSGARRMTYRDIVILVRNRTHVRRYEDALRAASIPYASADRGRLLECLEVRDLVALLDTLITPFNNLALASVLRCPLFACSDADLTTLAQLRSGTWMERLAIAAPSLPTHHPLRRAHTFISAWRDAAAHLPTHDLLDRIYNEGQVLERYHAAFAPHLRPRVRANLTRFLELALEVDSGRYPSLPDFLHRLRDAQRGHDDAPDEGEAFAGQDCVRLLTIHAAKGLESPAVFLADATNTHRPASGVHAVIDWPPDAQQPQCFLLTGKKDDWAPYTRRVMATHEGAAQRENINLLYVALTRAKQFLFVSGSTPTKGTELGWYGLIESALAPATARDGGSTENAGAVFPQREANDPVVIESGATTPAALAVVAKDVEPLPVDVRLSQRIAPIREAAPEITPSATAGRGDEPTADDDGQLRGIAIHRMLDLLTRTAESNWPELYRRLLREYGADAGEAAVTSWWKEAAQTCRHESFRKFFDGTQFDKAFNEVPVSYEQDSRIVHGVADRIVVTGSQVMIIDYKTHATATKETLEKFAAAYQSQLRLYANGARRLWPQHEVRALLLFTACRETAEISLQEL